MGVINPGYVIICLIPRFKRSKEGPGLNTCECLPRFAGECGS